MNRRQFLRLLGLAAAAPAAVAVANALPADPPYAGVDWGEGDETVLVLTRVDRVARSATFEAIEIGSLPAAEHAAILNGRIILASALDHHHAHICEHLWFYESHVERGSKAAQALLRHIGEHQDMLAAETRRFLEDRHR